MIEGVLHRRFHRIPLNSSILYNFSKIGDFRPTLKIIDKITKETVSVTFPFIILEKKTQLRRGLHEGCSHRRFTKQPDGF